MSAVIVVLGHASLGATDTGASMCLGVVGSGRRHETEPESRGRTCRLHGRAHSPSAPVFAVFRLRASSRVPVRLGAAECIWDGRGADLGLGASRWREPRARYLSSMSPGSRLPPARRPLGSRVRPWGCGGLRMVGCCRVPWAPRALRGGVRWGAVGSRGLHVVGCCRVPWAPCSGVPWAPMGSTRRGAVGCCGLCAAG